MELQRLAFIGVRGHYDRVLRALPALPHVRVVGLCDGGAEPMAPVVAWCRQHGHSPQIYDHYEAMLAEACPQAVIICGPFECHARMAIRAIRSGIHVLLEKPAALDFEDLARLQATLAEHPHVHLATMQTGRYDAGFYTAWRMIRDGAIGDVRLINARKSYKLGNREEFYRQRKTYGGTIPWVGAHAIDWVLWLGGHRVRSVVAGHSSVGNNGLGSLESSAMCHFTLCGDRFASVSLDVLRPQSALTHGDDWIRVVGTNGFLEARPQAVRVTNRDHDGTREQPLSTPPNMFEDFVAHIEGRRRH